ncbi:MAG: hypothetical protein GY941_19730 [Planctomycetes bacterium]|nr:hypothetical protein [Planctomycetota bacterium]
MSDAAPNDIAKFIVEARAELKQNINSVILEEISNFESKTGLKVSQINVNLIYAGYVGTFIIDNKLVDVNTEIELK